MSRGIHYRVIVLFLVSGAAALIYQICWQRLLFEWIGTDIESVTIIVSTFMLGLGLGSLTGGALADRFPDRALELFAIIEFSTAAFGIFSPALIRSVSGALVHASPTATAFANFGLLLIPTALMGATLPILVRRTLQLYRNMGESVGALYFSNTLGAAAGAAFTGFIALYRFGLSSTIYVAAALNIAVGLVVCFSFRSRGV